MLFFCVLLVLFCAVLLVVCVVLGGRVQARDVHIHEYERSWHERNERVVELETRFAQVMDADAELERVKGEVARRVDELASFEAQKIAALEALDERARVATARATRLEDDVRGLEEVEESQSFGVYEPRYRFESASRYGLKIKEVRTSQKAMIKDKTAAVCHRDWLVDGNKRKGQKMMANQIKVMLRAFNGECDAAISKVTYKNLETMEKRLRASRDAINKIMASGQYEITTSYLNLKLEELWLVHEHAEKKKEEADLQKLIKEQMREEAKAEKALEKATREAAKEEQSYEKALAKARSEFERANEDARALMAEQLATLERQLVEAQEKNQRAISQAQLTRSGHVYVISNVGSFGQGVYKIGLTRRLEPMDRVKELGDASVPFTFDVHAMIYSKDAPALEKQLHRLFDAQRVNKVNSRKEFFRVPLGHIEAAVHEHCGEEVEFVHAAEAEEYRKSKRLAPPTSPSPTASGLFDVPINEATMLH